MKMLPEGWDTDHKIDKTLIETYQTAKVGDVITVWFKKDAGVATDADVALNKASPLEGWIATVTKIKPDKDAEKNTQFGKPEKVEWEVQGEAKQLFKTSVDPWRVGEFCNAYY